MEIMVLDSDAKQCRWLCAILQEHHYQVTRLRSLNRLEKHIKENTCQVIILDLDSLPVDKSLFRKIKRIQPKMWIIGLSELPFHPELEEAMSSHISACLSKPVDEEELLYWLKSLC